jgi:AhpD family alkylhydroperoxidase
MRNYPVIADEFHAGFQQLGQDFGGPVKAFHELMGAATAAGALSTKFKELIAFAIAINVRCDGCLAHHAKAVLDAGATRQEVMEMIGVTLMMGGGPSAVYGVEALRAYDTFAKAQSGGAAGRKN